MDINNNQQTNTFGKGMNTDTSDMYISNDQYREAKNLRFMKNDGSSTGELRTIEGWDELDTLSSKFNNILATTSIRNYGIIIDGEYDGWNVWRWDKDKEIDSDNPKKIFGPCSTYLGENISLVTRWESENNIKLYIADGIHELMSLNIARVHENNTIEYLLNYAKYALTAPKCEELLSTGSLKSPINQYCYRLYDDYGKSTDVSPLSNILVLYKNLKQGFYLEDNINKAVRIVIKNNNPDFNNIIIYRISYVRNGQLPDVNIIADFNYDSTTEDIVYDDYGRNITSISSAEFLSQIVIKFKPLLIESKNDYLFCGQVDYVQDDIDDIFKDVKVTWEFINPTPIKVIIDKNFNITKPDNYKKSLKRGETYRYGIVFYDKSGRKSSVKHIADIEVVADNEHGDPGEPFRFLGKDIYYNPVGIQFVVRFGSRDVKDQCSGYEIVRCNRTMEDSKTLFLGIGGLTKKATYNNTNVRWADKFMSLQDRIKRYSSIEHNETVILDVVSSENIIQFASPETVYQPDDCIDILNTYANDINVKETSRYLVDHKGVSCGGLNSNRLEDGGTDAPVIDKNGDIRLAYSVATIKPYENYNKSYSKIESKIKSFTKTDSPDPSKFNDQNTVLVMQDTVSVGENNYTNWDADTLFWKGRYDNSALDMLFLGSMDISSGKRCILLNTEIRPYSAVYSTDTNPENMVRYLALSILEIQKTYYNPYGGITKQALLNSIYYSYGHYRQPEYMADSILIYDGDCYPSPFIYNSAHSFTTDRYDYNKNIKMVPVVYIVPIESSIDLYATSGDLYPNMDNRSKRLYFQDLAGTYNGFTQEKDAYLYNTIYNSVPNIIPLYSNNKKDSQVDKFDTRILYSKPKTNGELIDSWTLFLAANFIDVDTRFGRLTDLRLFKDALIFWQESATGVLSVNERTILQDANDTNIILGNGDVLLRYDYLTTEYGMMPNQYAETLSNSTLYWWDGYKKEILGYSGGLQVMPFKKAKTVNKYIDTMTFNDKPALAYDFKYNEVLANVGGKDTLVYNEVLLQFTSLYDITFQHRINFIDDLILVNDDRFYKWDDKGGDLKPSLKYVVNNNSQFVKVYDITTFGLGEQYHTNGDDLLKDLSFKFKTKDQESELKDYDYIGHEKVYRGKGRITNREYDYRFDIPRHEDSEWGNRMKGKTMQCELTVDNSTDFSIQYITTKYRISWS